MYTNRDVVFGWICVLKMMHNEPDAEDYIVWHRI